MIRNDEETRKRLRTICIGLFLAAAAVGGIRNYLTGSDLGGELRIERAPELPVAVLQKELASEEEGPSTAGAIESTESAAPTGVDTLIDINRADREELETLHGIGPAKASKIIEYREEYGGFNAVEELMEIKGIGPATFSKIKDSVCL